MPNNRVFEQYKEMIAPEQPGSATFSTDGAEATLDFIMEPQFIPQFLRDILGTCRANFDPVGDSGYLVRNLPMVHPQFSQMAAASISAVQGLGIDGRIINTLFETRMGDTNYNAPAFQATYTKYKLSIRFTTRPYLMLDDDQLRGLQNCGAVYNYPYRDKQNVVISQYRDWFEYLRFCSVNTIPAVEVLSNNRGQYYFRSNGAPAAEGAPEDGKPISIQNSGAVYKVVPRNIVKIKWYFVPYAMTESRGIKEGLNKINYGCDRTVLDCSDVLKYGYRFFGYPPGSLLFSSYKITPYACAFPPFTQLNNSPIISVITQLNNTYCDIEFDFIEAQVPEDELGILPDRATLTNNDIKILYGHNLVPYSKNNKFYYIESNQDNAKGWPLYLAYPMARLFQMIP